MAESMVESGLGLSEYARRTKRLIKIIGDIRALGGQSVVDLPRIAVIGNQSAGKSSLIEAISNITVPRAVGTCTRCPMECRLQQQHDVEWHCQVFLRFETDSEGRDLPEVKESLFGPLIHTTEDLEQMLRRAQLAILNPTIAAERFVELDLDSRAVKEGSAPFGSQEPQLAFSSNVVCVTVWGPNVPDLSFIDLPGIIQNEVEPGSMDAVKNMVMKHIQGNCLILLAITMRDDIENQNAAYLAKKVDPEGRRTLGVLTKPDTLQEGEERGWLDIIEGRKHQLTLGYYITKQPAPKDVETKISHEHARAAERDFFSNHHTWSQCPSHIRARMGTAQLGATLSKLLCQLIDRTLPDLRKDVREQQGRYAELLSAIPAKLSQPPAVALLNLITSYNTRLDSLVQGGHGHRKMIQHCNAAFRQLRRDIRNTAPHFIPQTERESRKAKAKGTSTQAFNLFDFSKAPPTGSATPGTPASSTPKTTQFQPPPAPTAAQVDYDAASDDSDAEMDAPGTEGKVAPKSSSSPIYLDDLKRMISSHVTRELPYNVPFSAKVEAINLSFDQWEDIAIRCADSITRACRAEALTMTRAVFGRFSYSELDRAADAIVEQQIAELSKHIKSRLQWLIEMESVPYSQNLHYFASYRDKYLSRYKSKRPGAASVDTEALQEALNAVRSAGFKVDTVKDLERLREPDPYEQELIVAAEVRAYFQIAYKRVIDNVPRIIDNDFIRKLRPSIEAALQAKFYSDEKAPARYMAEDPEVAARREDLEAKSVRLFEIGNKLDFSVDDV